MTGTYKAAVATTAKAPLVLQDRPVKAPDAGQILVKVEACGVCHSDAIVQAGQFGPLPRVPGHELIGRVDAVGANVTKWKKGDRVGGAWHGGHCFDCNGCQTGFYQLCQNAAINGVSQDDAEYAILRAEAAVRIPEAGKAAELAPLLCAGVTVYNGIRQMKIESGKWIAVSGLGGLGHLAVQYGRKMGYRVAALSRGADKKSFALELGASVYIDTEKEDAAEALQKLGGAALVVATAPNAEVITSLIGGIGPLGKLLLLTPVGDLKVPSVPMIMKGISVNGWPSGHAKDAEEAIAFAQEFGVKCLIEEYPLADVNTAFDRMLTSKARFRAVLTM